MVLFSRLVDDASPHGNYDLYLIGTDGSNEHALTSTGYAQGLSQWSCSGEQILFIVAAIDDVGMYDLYLMDADGSNSRSITPSYFPEPFLCRSATFSVDGDSIFFIGQWL
jgi:Tol biopolymer transport system component